jgi:uncharacterized protein (DUF58 family)
MSLSKSILMLSSIVGGMVIACASYGDQEQRKQERHSLAYAQATIAFAHYKTLERIEFLLARKCYDAALTEARWHKDAELVLLSENFAATGKDPELREYIKLRDPKVTQVILSGRLPDLRPLTTECP